LTYFAVEMAAPAALKASDRIENAVNVLLNCGWRAVSDIYIFTARSPRRMPRIAASLLAWVVPIVCGAVFTILLADANPIIAKWILALDPAQLFANLDTKRAAFWLLMASAVWPFLFVRIKRLLRIKPLGTKPASEALENATPAAGAARLFGKGAIL